MQPVHTCNMLICGGLRMSCNASWQNFADMAFPANLTITARTASKFCAGRLSQVKLSLISTRLGKSFLEFDDLGQNVIVHLGTPHYLKLHYISSNVIHFLHMRSPQECIQCSHQPHSAPPLYPDASNLTPPTLPLVPKPAMRFDPSLPPLNPASACPWPPHAPYLSVWI